MNKKGLSDVVTTVLIILLVIAAIVIVWVAVSKGIFSKTDTLGADCIALNIQATDCSGVGGTWFVKVHRESDEVSLQKVGLLFDLNTNETKKVEINSSMATIVSPLETNTYNVSQVGDLAGKLPVKVSVYGVVKYASGKIGTCNPTNQKIECTS